MINWVVGGLIIAATVYIIVRQVQKMRKGESSCCSSECGKSGCSGCSSK